MKDYELAPRDRTARGTDRPAWRTSKLNAARTFRVGEPFRAGRTTWPAETCYGIDRDGYVLTLFRSGGVGELAEALRREVVEFALIFERPLAVLAYRFGRSMPWETVPYAWPLTSGRAEARYLPPLRVESGTRALLWISLVDAETGLIEAQRGVALAPEFTLALNVTIRDQARAPFDGGAYVRAISSLHSGPDDSASILARAAFRTSSLD